MKKILTFLVAVFICHFAHAVDFVSDNIHYEVISEEAATIRTKGDTLTHSLKNVTLPPKVIYNEKEYTLTEIGYASFFNWVGMENITIPNSVKTIKKNAFEQCRGLKSIVIPNSVTYLETCAFQSCDSLTSAVLPESIYYMEYYIFRNCKNLTSVTLPKNYHEIQGLFWTTGFTSYTIPNSVTSIGWFAFYDCANLTSITIHENVNYIDQNAFGHCTALMEIHAKPITPPDSPSLLSFDKVDTLNCILYVPAGSEAAYANAPTWRSFKNIVAEAPASIHGNKSDDTSILSNQSGVCVFTNTKTLVTIFSIQGKMFYSKTISSDTQIPLKKGIYVVKSGINSTKVIVQ